MSFIENARLNKNQMEAALTTEGPLLILAGAGSGKTRVLTHRIAHLILDSNVSPWNILAITFTNKAAKEMKERIISVCGEETGSQVWVSTFHSACVRILHREIEAIGYGREFTIYDDDDQTKLLNDIIEKKNLSTKEYTAKEAKYVISTAKNKMYSPKKLADIAMSSREEVFAEIYDEYEKRMHSSNALDFDDLILKTTLLFDKFPEILEKYAYRFRYIHVDEYQDTNMTQYTLVKQLSSHWNNLCVVGDDDQSIYGWRGADIRNILEFEKDFANAKVIKLEQNYRSTNNILKSANAVIAHNEQRKEKSLWSEEGDGEKIRVEELPDGRAEAAFVVSEILQGYKNGASYNDFAVLYRTNSQSRLIEEMLLGSGIPYSVYGGQPFYGRKEVKDAIAYLRMIVNPTDEVALRRVINVPKRGIGDSAINEISQIALSSGDSMLGIVLDWASHPLSGRIKNKIALFASLIDDLMTQSMLMEPKEFIEYMLDASGLRGMYKSDNSDEAKERLANLDELVNAASGYFDDNPDATLADYLVNIALVSEPEESDVFSLNRGSVSLMTLHSAKGLEFDTVFLIGMEEGLFPLSRAIDNKEELEEERRLCYVGITRAKRRLYITHAYTRVQYGEFRCNPASRFLGEIPDKYCETLLPAPVKMTAGRAVHFDDGWDDVFEGFTQPEKKQSSFNSGSMNYSKPEKTNTDVKWKIAMKVKHRRFGQGRIIAVKGASEKTVLTVAFENNGVKDLVAEQANLEILGD